MYDGHLYILGKNVEYTWISVISTDKIKRQVNNDLCLFKKIP
jgi:hypothetical protein